MSYTTAELTAIVAANAGQLVTVTITDKNGTYDLTVLADRVTSKGFGYRNHGDEPLAYIGRTKITNIVPVTSTNDLFNGMSDDEVLTTAALAALFDTDRKALRVELRRVGLGVGKGRTYGLTPADVRPFVDSIRAGLAAA